MAYHLQSLVRVIELMLCHDTIKYFDNNTTPQIESLLAKVCFLRDAFENHDAILNRQDSFEDQIRDATQNAEDVLESYGVSFAIVPRTRSLNMNKLVTRFARFAIEHNIPPRELQKLHENFDSLKEEMMKIFDGDRTPAVKALRSVAPRVDQNPTNTVVGFKDDLSQLMDRVFGDSSKLEVIPIVGMGGIGKTTLARKIYHDSSIVSHFDTRAWATVSDDYNLRDILLNLLGYKRDEVEDNKLGLSLYQQLKGKRYIIVLDDIWRSNAWDDVKKCFPNENNGSRIILTTRQSDVATYVDSKSLHHQVHPLGEADSWELLRKKIFGDETCLPELEELGRKIATSCGGLPLAILVVGGILMHTESTKNSWQEVAGDVISTIANEDEHISSILSLSYNNLPYYLKSCFLYMSAFPEDFEIRASTLFRLWIAEGFLLPILGKTLEEVAAEHLNVLIYRNLIFVRQRRKTTGKVKTLGIHDLLRDLCVLKAREKKFFHVIKGSIVNNFSPDMLCLRRVSVLEHNCIGDIYGSTKQKAFARSLLYLSYDDLEMLPRDSSALQLLRVLEMGRNKFPNDLLIAVNLRYLSFVCWKDLHPSLTAFRNLQFLIIQGYKSIKVPQELFEMAHLREIVTVNAALQCDFKESRHLVLQENLHKVSRLFVSPNLHLFLAKRPNLKKLSLMYNKRSHTTVVYRSCLQKLEKLRISGDSELRGRDFLSNFSFPITLTSLTLDWSPISETCMTTLSMLPNLEVLELYYTSFLSFEPKHSNNWKMSEGKFSRLKYLRFDGLDIVNWECDETHFPILEYLEIRDCFELKTLPSCIGEIPTLETIKLFRATPLLQAWATQIREEQLDYGNELLQVYIYES